MDNCAVVAVKKVGNYDRVLVEQAISWQFEQLAVEKFIKPGMRVLLKPNLVTGRKPSDAITTHPVIVTAVANWLYAHGVRDITLADSSGGTYTPDRLRKIYHVAGLDDIPNIKLNFDVGFKAKTTPNGVVCRNFNLINPVFDADVIINLAKVKTHAMTTLSAGIKNLFGTIPGLQKPEMHYSYPDKATFSGMLIDLAETVAPTLTVLDGIEAMEGDGPTSGTVKKFGYLFASLDLYAQDYVVAKAMGIDPKKVDMLRIAKERALFDPASTCIIGDELQCEQAFLLPKAAMLTFMDRVPTFLQKPVTYMATKLLRTTPKILTTKCIGCGKCAESCPAHTIQIVHKKARIEYRNCISCFCCQEMCPVKAIDVKRKFR